MTRDQIKLGYAILYASLGLIAAGLLQEYFAERLRYEYTLKEKGLERGCVVFSE